MAKESRERKIDFIKEVTNITAKPYLDKYNINRVNFTRRQVHEAKVDLVLEDIINDLLLLAEKAKELGVEFNIMKGENDNAKD